MLDALSWLFKSGFSRLFRFESLSFTQIQLFRLIVLAVHYLLDASIPRFFLHNLYEFLLSQLFLSLFQLFNDFTFLSSKLLYKSLFLSLVLGLYPSDCTASLVDLVSEKYFWYCLLVCNPPEVGILIQGTLRHSNNEIDCSCSNAAVVLWISFGWISVLSFYFQVICCVVRCIKWDILPDFVILIDSFFFLCNFAEGLRARSQQVTTQVFQVYSQINPFSICLGRAEIGPARPSFIASLCC